MSPLTRKESLNTWEIKRGIKGGGRGEQQSGKERTRSKILLLLRRNILEEKVIFIWERSWKLSGFYYYFLNIFNFRTLRKYFYNFFKKKIS